MSVTNLSKLSDNPEAETVTRPQQNPPLCSSTLQHTDGPQEVRVTSDVHPSTRVDFMQCRFCKFTSSSQETLVSEMKKKQKNLKVIQQKMALTFSLRRREVVECQPMVSEVQERWPALFSSEELSEEFHRITSKDLLGTFNASLDKFVPGLLKLYRSKKGALGEDMEDLLDKLDEQTSDIVSHRKTAALRGLPIFLREDATQVFLECLDTDILEPVLNGASVAILTILQNDNADTSVREHAVVLEGDIVLHNIPDLSTALVHLFGLLYALNIDYPKQMSYTFEAIQAIFFELGSSRCSQRIRSLKTKLLL